MKETKLKISKQEWAFILKERMPVRQVQWVWWGMVGDKFVEIGKGLITWDYGPKVRNLNFILSLMVSKGVTWSALHPFNRWRTSYSGAKLRWLLRFPKCETVTTWTGVVVIGRRFLVEKPDRIWWWVRCEEERRNQRWVRFWAKDGDAEISEQQWRSKLEDWNQILPWICWDLRFLLSQWRQTLGRQMYECRVKGKK